MKGCPVEVLLRSGTIYEGLLESIVDGNNLNLVHVRKLPRDGKVATHMNILATDYISIKVKDFAPRQGKLTRICARFWDSRTLSNTIAGFQTDTGISKSSGPAKERELQKWVPEGDDFSQSLDGIIINLKPDHPPGTSWDQFAVNEQKFGVSTDYSDEFYTTTLDKSGNDFVQRVSLT